MLEDFLIIIAGFAILLWGADRFVLGASAIADNLGISPLVIGLTIVGFGTSAPEILISAVSSFEGNPGLAIGNAIGSNITNIAMVLGITALFIPLSVKSETLKREYPIMLAVTLVSQLLLMDGQFSRLDGAILITGMFIVIYTITLLGLRSRKTDPIAQEYDEEIPHDMSTAKAGMWLVGGLLLLLLGSKLLVNSAVSIATAAGVSDVIIGLTIVAIGTSLPELAASVVSAYKNEHDIAIGNIIGSNMFNLLAVLGLPGLIKPGPVPADILERDFPIMIGLTLLLFAIAYGFKGPGRINRLEGGLLLSIFIGYQVLIYFSGVKS
ncbi:MAG TPA: calcium/sodium antiporter [Gammaproteobacteria bacterium]|nr:calcium/sodium antiporter [Gammaproteobacteria bacterium]